MGCSRLACIKKFPKLRLFFRRLAFIRTDTNKVGQFFCIRIDSTHFGIAKLTLDGAVEVVGGKPSKSLIFGMSIALFKRGQIDYKDLPFIRNSQKKDEVKNHRKILKFKRFGNFLEQMLSFQTNFITTLFSNSEIGIHCAFFYRNRLII